MSCIDCRDSWLQFIYGDRNNDNNCGKSGQTCAPIPYHSHDLNDENLIFPPNIPQNSSANRPNDTNIELIDDSIGDNVSNETIEVQFNRGSHQSLVQLERDKRL